MYFLTYESLIHKETSRGIRREDIPEWKLCLFGALYFSLRKAFLTAGLVKRCGWQHIPWVSHLK
jgi:hypothetical protein